MYVCFTSNFKVPFTWLFHQIFKKLSLLFVSFYYSDNQLQNDLHAESPFKGLAYSLTKCTCTPHLLINCMHEQVHNVAVLNVYFLSLWLWHHSLKFTFCSWPKKREKRERSVLQMLYIQVHVCIVCKYFHRLFYLNAS